jgi:hypothetical protein
MPSFIGLTVLTAVLCGGAWGWRVGTSRLYRRSYFDDDNRGGRVWRRRIRRRYLITALYALLSALVAYVLVMALKR